MLNRIKLMICGREYMLQTEESANYVNSLAKLLEKKMNDITSVNTSISPYSAAVMVALATLDDLSKSQANVENIRAQTKEYVDEAGKARIERDAALKEIDMLKLKIDRLEKAAENK